MKILVLDNPALVDELREQNEVVTAGRWEERYQLVATELHPSLEEMVERCSREFFAPDALLFIEGGVKHLWRDMDRVSIPKAYYAIDAHLHFSWQRNYARTFDALFVAQKDYRDPFQSWGVPSVHWVPLACSDELDKDLGQERDIDVCFVGKLDPKIHPERLSFLEGLKQRLPNSLRFEIRSGEFRELFNRSKIILNESINRDLNQRVFEAMACGGMLLTENMEAGLRDLFVPGEDLVVYEHGNVQEAADRILFFLEHPEERLAIAAGGHAKTRGGHTSRHRAAEIARLLGTLVDSGVPSLWTARRYHDYAKTFLMLAYPNSPVCEERLKLAAVYFLKSLQEGATVGTSNYLALISILQRNSGAAFHYLTEALKDPGEHAVACWIMALLLSGQDPARSEVYYQSCVRALIEKSPLGPLEYENFLVASTFLKEKLRANP